MKQPDREADDLIQRYADIAPQGCRPSDQSETTLGAIKMLIGIGLTAAGVMLTFSSSGSVVTIYWGMVWVGIELLLFGIIGASSGKGYDDLTAPVQAAVILTGAAVALLFTLATMDDVFNQLQ